MDARRHYPGKTTGLTIYFSAEGSQKHIPYETLSAIRAAIYQALRHENVSLPAEVSVVLCDNMYIHRLNRKYRNVDRPTDVLSFPMMTEDDPMDGGTNLLGDIVISLERAAEQAKEIGNTVLREIQFLCVHSVLHLLGYDHERSAEDEEIMCQKQREIMEKIKAENGDNE